MNKQSEPVNLSNLELRKAALEALGWRQVDLISKTVWRCKLDGSVYDHNDPGCYCESAELPAIESDPAAAWPIFTEWLSKQNGVRAEIVLRSRDQECCIDLTHDNDGRVCMVFGGNICEAIAKAIIAGRRQV